MAVKILNRNFAIADGIRYHYLTTVNNASSDTILLLAGFPQSSYAWRKVIPLLAEDYSVIAVDLPGQGDTDYPIDGYDTDSISLRLKKLLDSLEIKRFHLVGHDIGAWVAFSFANNFPEIVQSLCLLDAGIPGVTLPEALPVTLDKAWKTWHFSFHMVPDLAENLIQGKEAIYLEWFLRKKAANPFVFEEKDMQEYLRIFSKSGSFRAAMQFYRSVEQSALQNKKHMQYTKISMPLLAVSSDQGSIPDMATPLKNFSKNIVQGIKIENCGHFIPEEQPEVFADHLLSFIKENT
ncbi:hydrolase [Acinetobacter pittii]|uniref:alpha/beta fold hydrolase n=1 Tax=Acinetobacter pittii TaxID=48296 RepID=UPI000837AC6F|nr:alpha/beta hydrolase [Acinetobacter pittii]OCY33922.1 hydrolase [Acinetobacter pittii]